MFRRPLLAALVVFLALPVFAACIGSVGDDHTPVSDSPTPAPEATSTPAPIDIRTVDLATDPIVKAFLSSTGGELSQDDVLYADLTGDANAEAIVPVSSGGTLGNLGFLVLAPTSSGTRQLLAVNAQPVGGSGITVAVENGQLVETQAAYGTDDPLCCPTQLRKTTYAWDGSQLGQASSVLVPNPDAGGAKFTPTPGQ
ncbi:MAG TPA: hypothetical protein VFC53_09350 [Dehalococcoidia bacterium]|jgi:hypothetical protein|nr:hypothetical protein [Dehalococcoidia bacterium]